MHSLRIILLSVLPVLFSGLSASPEWYQLIWYQCTGCNDTTSSINRRLKTSGCYDGLVTATLWPHPTGGNIRKNTPALTPVDDWPANGILPADHRWTQNENSHRIMVRRSALCNTMAEEALLLEVYGILLRRRITPRTDTGPFHRMYKCPLPYSGRSYKQTDWKDYFSHMLGRPLKTEPVNEWQLYEKLIPLPVAPVGQSLAFLREPDDRCELWEGDAPERTLPGLKP